MRMACPMCSATKPRPRRKTPKRRRWVTGSDLSVFTLDVDNQTKVLFPFTEFQGKQVDAFSPTFAALPNGKIWLSMMVGPRLGAGAGDAA